MNRLINHPRVTYDTNMIIYYCFSTKNHEIIEYTSKTQKLTELLVKNNTTIIIPQFIINEINNTSFSKIVFEYIARSSEVTNIPKDPTYLFRIELEGKIRKKFNNFLKKDWIEIEDYSPSDSIIENIGKFFSHRRL